MKGDFSRLKGDLSRHTFERLKHYAGVLHQQGRVWLDSDWNTEVLLRLNLLRQETFDIIGRCGAPAPGTALTISPPRPGSPLDAFEISGGPGPEGRYYVDGILCQLDRSVTYLTQPDFPNPPRLTIPPNEDLNALVYIEVWQRLITYLEDEAIREVALGGPDTATRVKTIAQVKVAPLPRRDMTCEEALAALPASGGTLTTLQPTDTLPPDPCRLPDPASYTGRENHLYRVEIHDAGDVIGSNQGFVFSIKLASDANVGAVNLALVSALTAAEAKALRRSGFVIVTTDDGQLERAPLSDISQDGRTLTLARGLLNSFTTARNATVTGGVARFKWSRDNASFGVRVTAVSTDRRTLTLASLGRDQVTALREGDLVEIVDDASELGPAIGHLTNLTANPNPDTFTVTIADSLPPGFGAAVATSITSPPAPFTLSPPAPDGVGGHLILRRWDGQGVARAVFNETTTPQLNLGDGVHIQFGGSDLQSGDYWQFAARSVDGSIEALNNARPMGISRHRCALALVRWGRRTFFTLDLLAAILANFPTVIAELRRRGRNEFEEEEVIEAAQAVGLPANQIEVIRRLLDDARGRGRTTFGMTVIEDCREPFRPLTDLECDCKCTLTVRPGPNWEQVFNQIRAGQDAEVCFQVGRYPVSNTVVVEGKGNLILTGSGVGSLVSAPDGETAIRFVKCKSVKVRDLRVESGRAGEGFDTPLEHLNGALAFDTCADVELDHVTLKCAHGKWRAATCVTVANSPLPDTRAQFPPCNVRINRCDLKMGHLQTGMLLLNVSRAQVEDNTLEAVPLPSNRTFRDLIADRATRTRMRKLLISDTRIKSREAAKARLNTVPVLLRAGKSRIDFSSPREIPQSAWDNLLERNPPPENVNTAKALLKHVNNLVDRVLLEEVQGGVPAPFRDFVRAVATRPVAVAAQGIVVAGVTTPEARILNNSVADVVQGIHLGLSRGGEREVHLQLGMVTVEGNRVDVVLTADAARKERHGIFVGNCESLLVENNHVSIRRLGGTASFRIDGIRVWGELGDRALITQNHCFPLKGDRTLSFDIGIDFNPLARSEESSPPLWLAMYNVAPSRLRTIRLVNGAAEVPGTNLP